MRHDINGYPIIRGMTVEGDTENPLKVQADGEFIYIPQVVYSKNSERLIYYLEIPKRLLQIGVGVIND